MVFIRVRPEYLHQPVIQHCCSLHFFISTLKQSAMVHFITAIIILPLVHAYAPAKLYMTNNQGVNSRRNFVSQGVAFTLGTVSAPFITGMPVVEPANAVGPVKIKIINPQYTAAPCPPSKPIPVRYDSSFCFILHLELGRLIVTCFHVF